MWFLKFGLCTMFVFAAMNLKKAGGFYLKGPNRQLSHRENRIKSTKTGSSVINLTSQIHSLTFQQHLYFCSISKHNY
ncbi:hypothetical protein COP00_03390 [Bacillus glycinifermentans]|nr:hypothetical protein COP00_03390 [Bacillus glycinifermentans]